MFFISSTYIRSAKPQYCQRQPNILNLLSKLKMIVLQVLNHCKKALKTWTKKLSKNFFYRYYHYIYPYFFDKKYISYFRSLQGKLPDNGAMFSMDKNMISAKRNIPGIIILSQEKYCFVFTKNFFSFFKKSNIPNYFRSICWSCSGSNSSKLEVLGFHQVRSPPKFF